MKQEKNYLRHGVSLSLSFATRRRLTVKKLNDPHLVFARGGGLYWQIHFSKTNI